MFFSILIPAYKATYIKETIQSVLNQTYKDFELIIVDDASPEPIRQIVDDFTSSHKLSIPVQGNAFQHRSRLRQSQWQKGQKHHQQ